MPIFSNSSERNNTLRAMFAISHALLTVVLWAIATSSSVYADQSLDTVRSRMEQDLISHAPSDSSVQRLIDSLKADGAWPDVDYADKTRGGWKVAAHLYRVSDLAKSYSSPKSKLHGNPQLLAAIEKALENWRVKDYQCPNWWYNKIGCPQTMADIILLMQHQVKEETVEGGLKVIRRGAFGMTGQNSVWLAGITFKRAVIEGDTKLAMEARDLILKDLVITTAEGLQPDWSFHQHGPQQQFGNYGLSFAGDMSEWGVLWAETDLALSPEQIELLRGYVFRGLRATIRGGRMDNSSCGRQISPGHMKSKAQGVVGICSRMKQIDPECAEYYQQIIDGKPYVVGPSLNWFWRSDYFTRSTAEHLISVKMSSSRVIGCETCNSENMLGYHLADGATYVYIDGDEYDEIFPVWDWLRLPGVTCSYDTQRSLVPRSKVTQSDFVGGMLVDDDTAVLTLDYNRDGVSAKKSWFFIGDKVVCLGAGINSQTDHPINTTINQCLLNGPVQVCDSEKQYSLEKGEQTTIRDARWFWHDRVVYRMLQSTDLIISTKSVTGNWKRVRYALSDQPVTRDVMLAWIDHGTTPHDASYAYVIEPNVENPLKEQGDEINAATYELLKNNADMQIVYDTKHQRLLAVFYKAGEFDSQDGMKLSVENPCLIAVRYENGNPVEIHVDDPTRKLEKISGIMNDTVPFSITMPSGELKNHQVSYSK